MSSEDNKVTFENVMWLIQGLVLYFMRQSNKNISRKLVSKLLWESDLFIILPYAIFIYISVMLFWIPIRILFKLFINKLLISELF